MTSPSYSNNHKKSIHFNLNVEIFADKGANPKSPLGIASAFSRASPAAIFMSNTSLLLEYASEEFINHLEQ